MSAYDRGYAAGAKAERERVVRLISASSVRDMLDIGPFLDRNVVLRIAAALKSAVEKRLAQLDAKEGGTPDA